MESFDDRKKGLEIGVELNNRINQNRRNIETYKAEIAVAKKQIAEIRKTAKKYTSDYAEKTSEQLIENLGHAITSAELLISEAEQEIAEWQNQLFAEVDSDSKPS